MAKVPLLVPIIGVPPLDPPSISLNPKRNFTLVCYSAAASSGSFAATDVAVALNKQLTLETQQTLPLPSFDWVGGSTYFKNMVVRRVDAWGVADSITYAPFSLKSGQYLPHVPTPPTVADSGGGSNSRPRASVIYPGTSWYNQQASPLNKLVTYTGVMRIHVHVTVW